MSGISGETVFVDVGLDSCDAYMIFECIVRLQMENWLSYIWRGLLPLREPGRIILA